MRDPRTGRFRDPNKPWDLGHVVGHEYRKAFDNATKTRVPADQFRDLQNNPDTYRPELPSRIGRGHVTDVSESSKLVAQKVAEAFGKRPKITIFWDLEDRHNVAIAAAGDSPTEGISSYSTVNLSDWPMYVDGVEHETRVEIAGSAPNDVRDFQSAVSTAAFCVINGRWPCRPGVIYPDILAMYHMSMTMKHVLFMEPVVWERIEESIQLPDRLVTWVMMVPIADSEYEYAKEHGWEALGQIFEDRDVDYWDLKRKPLV